MNLPTRPPIIVNHMAALDGAAPPNSLEAIRACLDAGAAFIEIDVTALAADDYLLVHDPVLQSETTGAGAVGAAMPEAARELFIRYRGTKTTLRVPLLGEVVALLLDHPTQARLQIDFKNMTPFADDEPLHRLLRLIEPLGARVIVSSGADWQLRKLRRFANWLDIGFDIGNYMDWREPEYAVHPVMLRGAYGYWDEHPLAAQRFWPTADYLRDRCEAFMGLVAGVSTFYISHRLLAQSLREGFNWAERLHEGGIKLDAWTLDVGNPEAEANARVLLAAGVDQFTTNTPRELAALLKITR